MHGHGRAGKVQIEQEVAVGHGVERVGDDLLKAHSVGGRHAVERISGAGKRGGTQRRGIGGFERGDDALVVAREHPVIRQKMMREQHGLGMLQVRHAGKYRLLVRLCHFHQNAAKVEVRLHKVLGQGLHGKAGIGRYLIVARATGMQALAGLADAPRKLAFDRHVNILVVDVEDKVAGVDLGLDLVKALRYSLGIRVANDALLGQHAGVRLRSSDILFVEVLVDRQRRAELLRGSSYAAFEPSAPQCHDLNPFSFSGPAGCTATGPSRRRPR